MTMETTTDEFLGGRLSLRQPAKGFRTGLDGVLLAASCRAVAGETVVDCGAATGAVGLCVARRIDGVRVTLLEREPTLAGLARQNAAANALEDRVEVIAADLLLPLSQSGIADRAGKFDHALANPPYHPAGRGTPSGRHLRDQANVMPPGSLDKWLRFMAAMTVPGGTATVIHLASELRPLLDAFGDRFGALRVLPILPRAQSAASRILVSGVKGSRADLKLLAPLVLHGSSGSAFRPEIEAILRSGAPLPDCWFGS